MRALKLFGVSVTVGLVALVTGSFGQVECTVTITPEQSIQQAIDAASEGAVICLSAGTWEENIEIKKGLTLRGAGQDPQGQWLTRIHGLSEEKYGPPAIRILSEELIYVTVLALAAQHSNAAAVLQVEGQAHVQLQHVAALSTWSGPSFLTKDAARVLVQNSELSGSVTAAGSSEVTLNDVRLGGRLSIEDLARLEGTHVTIKFGVTAQGKAQLALSDSQILGIAEISGQAQMQLTRVQLKGGESHGVWVRDEASLEMSQGKISGYGGCGIFVDSPRAQIQGTENEFRDNGVDLCGYAPAALRKPLVPQTGRRELTVPDDYRSLQEAIDAIAPGGTITVRPGGYSGGLTIWKPLVLQGDTTTVIRPATQAKIAPTISIIAAAHGVRLERLLISGFTPAWLAKAVYFTAGVLIYGEATLHMVEIDSHATGLTVAGRGSASLEEAQLQSNFIGMLAVDTSQIRLVNSQIFNNFYFGVAACAELELTVFKPECSSKVSLKGVIIFGQYGGGYGMSLGKGVTAAGAAQITMQSSFVFENTYGVSLSGSAQLSLQTTEVVRNLLGGLSLWGASQAMGQASIFSHNGTSSDCYESGPQDWKICNGITVAGQAQLTLRDSTIEKNTDWGVAVYLQRCGYAEDNFDGHVILEGTDVIAGNNTAGNHQGEVCLPESAQAGQAISGQATIYKAHTPEPITAAVAERFAQQLLGLEARAVWDGAR